MNEESVQRVKWAKSLAAAFTSHPNVQAIILGGSAARGVVHERSDIDLGIFWSQIASQEERSERIRGVGGQLDRFVQNHHRYRPGNPSRQGCLEIIDIKPTSNTPRLRLDIEHETVVGAKRVLSDIVDQYDPSLEKQELLSVIEYEIVLCGHDLVDRWREKTHCYSDELVEKMVTQHLSGIGENLLDQFQRVSNQDWICLYEGLLDLGRRLLLTLMGLNRVWVFTDNPDFKGVKSFTDGFKWQPDQFLDRLGLLLQSNTSVSIHGFADLTEDVLALPDVHLPAVNTSNEREMLKRVKHRTAQ